jgi:Ca2+-binding RTX toxin-like protein
MRVRRSAVRASLPFVIAALLLLTTSAAATAPPGNDSFGSRTTIATIPFSEMVSTVEATTEPGEPESLCGPVGKTVWYQYTPPSETVLGASATASNFDAVVSVWTGSDLNTLAPVGCGDDLPNVVFRAHEGTTYLIQLGGFDGDSGIADFRLRPVDAGHISGKVTEEGTGNPLGFICVSVFDADLDTTSFEVTDGAGAFTVPVRSGRYLLLFEDFCDASSDHRSEWYDNAPDLISADEVEVSAPSEVTLNEVSLARTCPNWGGSNRTQFIGTDGPDMFRGGAGPEIFCGLRGADVLRGAGGRDTLSGGPGPDRLFGGADHDTLLGDKGDDRLRGGPGKDFCRGEAGQDESRGCDRKGLKA